mgnify:CR=1 FL=1
MKISKWIKKIEDQDTDKRTEDIKLKEDVKTHGRTHGQTNTLSKKEKKHTYLKSAVVLLVVATAGRQRHGHHAVGDVCEVQVNVDGTVLVPVS